MPSANSYHGREAAGKTFKNELFGEYTVKPMSMISPIRPIHLYKDPTGEASNVQCLYPEDMDNVVELVHRNPLYPHLAHLEKEMILSALKSILYGRSSDVEIENPVTTAAALRVNGEREKLSVEKLLDPLGQRRPELKRQGCGASFASNITSGTATIPRQNTFLNTLFTDFTVNDFLENDTMSKDDSFVPLKPQQGDRFADFKSPYHNGLPHFESTDDFDLPSLPLKPQAVGAWSRVAYPAWDSKTQGTQPLPSLPKYHDPVTHGHPSFSNYFAISNTTVDNSTSKQGSRLYPTLNMPAHMMAGSRITTNPGASFKSRSYVPNSTMPGPQRRRFPSDTLGTPRRESLPPTTEQVMEAAKKIAGEGIVLVKEVELTALTDRVTSLENTNKELAKTVAKHAATPASAGISKDIDLAALMRRMASLEAAIKDLNKTIAEREIIIDSKIEHARDRNEEALEEARDTIRDTVMDGVLDSISDEVAELVAEHFSTAKSKLEKRVKDLKAATKEAKDEISAMNDKEGENRMIIEDLLVAVKDLRSQLNEVKLGHEAAGQLAFMSAVDKNTVNEVDALRSQFAIVRAELAGARTDHEDKLKQVEKDCENQIQNLRAAVASAQTTFQVEVAKLSIMHQKLFNEFKEFTNAHSASIEEVKTISANEVAKLRADFDGVASVQHATTNALQSKVEENATNIYATKEAIKGHLKRDLKRVKADLLKITNDIEMRHTELGEEFESFKDEMTEDVADLRNEIELTDDATADLRTEVEDAQESISALELDVANLKKGAAVPKGDVEGESVTGTTVKETGSDVSVADTDEDFDELDELEAASQCGSDFEVLEEQSA